MTKCAVDRRRKCYTFKDQKPTCEECTETWIKDHKPSNEPPSESNTQECKHSGRLGDREERREKESE